ncbi:diguanylate cyclase domain-containing protein [Zongyangia hominis]|uniref:Stage 0 sporulation protein A homolog n=1 Tax=Zongyangia hominis TaxID=2763677 RepID=A0A926EGQ0_9FIRM|nr:diguanylate cyclase [Zongyangia hominis]MBC8571362.1 diguanylate cyclase [Zongyangia hominis]
MKKRDTILIVDDMEINRAILGGLFQDEYKLMEAENGEQALLLLKEYHSSIAIVLLDLVMPVKSGYQVMEELGGSPLLDEVPVAVITADNSLESELRVFDLGASDIIVKPFEPHVVKRRVHNIIELSLHKHNLEDMVAEQAVKLQESNEVLIDALSSVIEYRSLESGQHIRRIRLLMKALLEEVWRNCPEYNLDEEKIRVIASASAMHDIGKIAIPDSILNKLGRLTPEEFKVMETHTIKGCEILAGLSRMSDQDYLRYAYSICRYHHERWDGGGYPDGLVGDAIPIWAQAAGIADAYDALTSDRVYKKAISHERAAAMILGGECGAFSTKLLECFKNAQPTLAALVQEYADGNVPSSDTPELPPIPVLPESGINPLEIVQMKYYAMLRYENVAAVEVDLAAGRYQMAYAPRTAIRSLFQGGRLEDAVLRYINEVIHPDDRDFALSIWWKELPRFFEEGRLKQSWKNRIYDAALGGWRWFEVTALRIDTEHPRQRKALFLWRDAEADESVQYRRPLGDGAVLHRILGGIFQCQNDPDYTLLHCDDGFLGYSKAEIRQKYQNRFIRIIHPDDRERVVRQLREQLNRGASFQLELRVTDGRGQVFWVMSRGQMITDSQGNEILYSVLIDIDGTKRAQEELRLSLERYKIILEQTNDIIFEWDIATDVVTYSSNWKEKFGYEPIGSTASARIPTVSHLHPEDMAAFGRFIEEMSAGKRYGELEFRLLNKDSQYIWCRIRGTAQMDDEGMPLRVVGMLVDINDEKVATQKLMAKAEQDTLTGLHNKAASRQRIEAYLAQREKEEVCALFIIDMDNFKFVNDRFGHLFGDAVLTKVAALLGRLFRSQDIVSRIGGDEFLVLIRDAGSAERVQSVAERIIESFQRDFNDLPEECEILCSVGVSICPQDGGDFQTLFQRADMALYQAKERGKNQYHFYDAGSAFPAGSGQTGYGNARTAFDRRAGASLDEVASAALSILNETTGFEKAVESVLEMVGRRFQVSRCYIFENLPDDDQGCSNTFEWCAQGIPSTKETLQDLRYNDYSVTYKSYFNERGIFYCTDVTKLPEDLRAVVEKMGIKSMLQCMIRDNGKFKGWVGFDDCTDQVLWTQDQIDALNFVSGLLSLFLLKRRAQEKAIGMSQDLLTLLDQQNSWIYVLDPDTYSILYINQKTRSLLPEAREGMHCFEAFMGRKVPCESCPMRSIRQTRSCTLEIYNQQLGIWSSADATLIPWQKREGCLVVCRDITHLKEREARTEMK